MINTNDITTKVTPIFKEFKEWVRENLYSVSDSEPRDIFHASKKEAAESALRLVFYRLLVYENPNDVMISERLKMQYEDFNDLLLQDAPLVDNQERRNKKNKRKKDVKEKHTSEYLNYLISNEWRSFRKSIIDERGSRCERCQREDKVLHLHHKTYARLFKELPTDVSLLCKVCHKLVHSNKKKYKEFFI